VTDKDFHSLTDTNTVNDHPWKRVATCYSVVDRFFPVCGMFDLLFALQQPELKSRCSKLKDMIAFFSVRRRPWVQVPGSCLCPGASGHTL